MYKYIPEMSFGNWKIVHEYDDNQKYCSLYNGNLGAMIDHPTEYERNKYFIDTCYGNVLIAGLGMGAVILSIMDKKNVKNVDVVEIDKELIDIIKNYVPFNSKINIINKDIENFIPKKNYDSIWIDIELAMKDTMNIEYKNKFKKYLTTNGFIKCWRSEWVNLQDLIVI